MEESSKEFKKCPNDYIHRGEVTFDTGLEMKMLQKYFYLSIDNFFSIMDNKDDKSTLSELEAWMYFIGSDRPEHMEKIIHIYPKFKKMYEEINVFRKKPKEAVGMFSDALRIMDENTVKLMIEQQKEELRAQAEIIEQNKVIIAENNAVIAENNAVIAENNAVIADKEAEIAEKEAEIAEKEAEIAEKEAEIAEKEAEIAEKEAEIAEKDAEIARLKAQLENRK